MFLCTIYVIVTKIPPKSLYQIIPFRIILKYSNTLQIITKHFEVSLQKFASNWETDDRGIRLS